MKFKLLLGVVVLMVSCNNNDSGIESKTDSIGKKFDSFASKTWDSTRLKAKELKDKVEDAIKRDSAN